MSDHCSASPVLSGVKMTLSIGGQELAGTNFAMQFTPDGTVGTYLDYTLRMEMTTDVSVLSFRAVLTHPQAVGCDWIRVDADVTNIVPEACLVPCYDSSTGDTTLHRPRLGESTPESALLCGLFQKGEKPCVLFATKLPQSSLHTYQAAQIGSHTVRISAKTRFTAEQKPLTRVETETTMVYLGLSPAEALKAYASHAPGEEIPVFSF